MRIDAQLWQAYSAVKFDFEYKMTCGSYAIITAWNPESVKLSDYENCVNNQQLEKKLERYDYVPLRVGDQTFNWYEESFAVVMPLEVALSLGKAFGQNAIYYVIDNVLYLHSCVDTQSVCLGLIQKRMK